MQKLKKYNFHIPLIICLLILMIVSIITISSAMTYLPNQLGNLAYKQFFWYLICFVVIYIIMKISNETIYRYSWYIYITNIILLFILLIVGQPINGSKCWFVLPGIGSFQPSEFMKIAIAITSSVITSNWINNNRSKNFGNDIKILLKIGGILLLPITLTFLEPDTGAIFIYVIICISILWVSGLRKRWFFIGIMIIGIIIGSILGIYFLNKNMFINSFGTDFFYRIDRILAWKNGTGMQLENSLTAIGSSGLLGHGYNNTPIYFPESGTDFIFAVFASNFGLIGCLLLILIIIYFDISIIRIAKNTNNYTDKLLITGFIGMILYQQFQNIGMTLGLLPITGITLPFISYGGSSLLSYMIMMGMVFNVHNNSSKTIN